MISIIVACDPDGVIGRQGMIPWHLPEDLQLFKDRTMNSNIVMGRVTWDSLPKKPLLGRVNYVISRQPPKPPPHTCMAESLAGPIFCKNLTEALSDIQCGFRKKTFIIGGQQVYEAAFEMGIVEQIIVSVLKERFNGDRYFKIPAGWECVSSEPHEGFDVVVYNKSRV